MKNVALYKMNKNPHLLLCYGPFKGLCNGCWLPGVMSDSPGSHTPGRLTQCSIIPRGDWLAGYATPVSLTFRGMRPQGDIMENLVPWLPGVWYPGEFDYPEYDTPASQAHRGIKPREVMFWRIFYWLAGVWYPGESCFTRHFQEKFECSIHSIYWIWWDRDL